MMMTTSPAYRTESAYGFVPNQHIRDYLAHSNLREEEEGSILKVGTRSPNFKDPSIPKRPISKAPKLQQALRAQQLSLSRENLD